MNISPRILPVQTDPPTNPAAYRPSDQEDRSHHHCRRHYSYIRHRNGPPIVFVYVFSYPHDCSQIYTEPRDYTDFHKISVLISCNLVQSRGFFISPKHIRFCYVVARGVGNICLGYVPTFSEIVMIRSAVLVIHSHTSTNRHFHKFLSRIFLIGPLNTFIARFTSFNALSS